ncbi:CHAT domain-containing protein [Kitasatospora sp. NPDC057692]|uniref:CHAT domain-containing protein n=1 Tax=Kitasatospora sp. NPDC057692 TaxID=3346215 RepID=UPI0036CAA000
MAVEDEARALIGRGRRLLEEHDAAADPRRGALALSGALTAFAAARGLLEEAGADGPAGALAEARFLVGVTLSARYWNAVGQPEFAEDDGIRSGVLAERADAVGLLGITMAAYDRGSPEWTEAALQLGILLHARFEDGATAGVADPTARPDDLDRAVEALRLVCPAPVPPGPWTAAGEDAAEEAQAAYDAQHPAALATLGCALADRADRAHRADHAHRAHLADREHAAADRAAADAVLQGFLDRLHPAPWSGSGGPPGPVDLADPVELEVRGRLVRLLLDERDGGADARGTARAVAHLERIVAATAPGSPHRLPAALRLVGLYCSGGQGQDEGEDGGDGDDTAHQLARLRELRRLFPPDHPLGGTVRWLLGDTLSGLSQRKGYTASAEAREGVEVLREGVAGMAEDDPVRPAAHGVLGTLVNALRQHEPEVYGMEEALHHLTRALDTMQEEELGGLHRGDVLHHLAHATLAKEEFSTDRAELDRVIGLLDAARARPSPDSRRPGHDPDGPLAAAMGKRFALTGSVGDLEAAIRHQRAAFRRAAPDDANRVVYLENLSVNLYQRYVAAGDPRDLEASRRYTEEVLAHLSVAEHAGLEGLVATERPVLERTRALLEFQEAVTSGDVPGMTRAVEALERLVAAVPEDDPLRLPALGDLGAALFVLALHGRTDLMTRALGLMTEAAERTPVGHLYRSFLRLRAAAALGAIALARTEASSFERRAETALRYLDDFLADTGADPAGLEGSRAHLMRAVLLLTRYHRAGRPEDAAGALAAAGAVREGLRHGAPTQLLAGATWITAMAHRARLGPGDRQAAREAGLATLRQTAAAVLLQASAAPALALARESAARALTIARWHLADPEEAPGDADADLRAAVAALELGRGLVLHASTATTDVPDLLRTAGHPDLAEAWLAGGAPQDGPDADAFGFDALLGLPGTLLDSLPGGADIPVPDDLRRRALTALAAHPTGEALMGPLPLEEIARSLRAAGADALVYLLPPGAMRSGEALLVTPGEDGAGALHLLPLTLVTSDAVRSDTVGPLTAYRRAHRDRQATLDTLPPRHPARAAARRRWQAALAELCDWAGIAALRPLLRHPALRVAARRGPQAPPRLVLVPFGELGGIPWHAALLSSGLRDGGRPVRAVERVAISYAASARQFCEVVGRPRLPLAERPVIVGDPTRELMFAEAEAEYLHADHYPHGTLLGYVEDAVGAGTPAEVLAELPAPGRAGASVLHLACHALPSERSPLDAYLGLAPDPRAGDRLGRLPVGDILRQAQGRPPGSPGGLVVLDACVSDHTGGDVDEALTLSSAFLAAGATGVVGSRWEVVDDMVCVLMYVFHGRLAAGDSPAEALRRTQLWALDPDRGLPPGAPAELVSLARRDPGALDVWAAFVYQGG